jgi:hypothetical protein
MVQVREQTDDERLAAAVTRALDEFAPGGTYVPLLALCDRVEEDLGQSVGIYDVAVLRDSILGRDEDAEYERRAESGWAL